MHKLRTHALFLWVLLSRVSGQPDPYDNDYSGIKNFQEFAYLAPVATPSSNLGIAAAGVFGLVIGHFSPLRGGASKKSSAQLEQLYKIVSAKNVEIQKLKTMVYEFEYRNQELKQALFESEQESLKRDYEEFKQPDANGDDVISRNEFSTYIQNYMKAYPHIPPEDYPTFEDFDMNRDGLVTFQEWQEYLYQQQLAEQQQQQQQSGSKQQKNTAVNSMYGQSSSAQSFQTIYEQLQQQQQQQQGKKSKRS